MSSEMSKTKNLSSLQLLADFAKYCEIKRGCPHLSLDEEGTPCCRQNQHSKGRCEFFSCPRVRGANHE